MFFKNLAGNNVPEPERSEIVMTELLLTELTPIEELNQSGEVKVKWKAELNGWTFRRAWRYWIVKNENSGFTLEQAQQFAAKEMPNKRACGEYVRVSGGAGGSFLDEDNLKVPEKIVEGICAKYGDFSLLTPEKKREFHEALQNYPHKYVCSYHVDNLLGLKYLVEAIREAHWDQLRFFKSYLPKIKPVDGLPINENVKLAYAERIFNEADLAWIRGQLNSFTNSTNYMKGLCSEYECAPKADIAEIDNVTKTSV